MRQMADQEDGGDRPRPEIITGSGRPLPFNIFIARFARGDFVSALNSDMDNMGEALNQYFQDYRGEPTGQIDISLKFKLKGGHVEVTAEKKVKLPKMPAHAAIFYIDRQNHFVEEDPKQPGLFPRGV